MPFGWFVIIVTVILGAVVAWAGDRIGHKVGRQRMTMFGLRPRYTSFIVTVVTGALIVLVTLTAFALLSQRARTALFGIETLNATIQTLETDRQRREAELNELHQRLASVQGEIDRLNQELSQLRADRDALRQTRQELLAERDRLTKERERLTSEKDRLTAENARLERERNDLEVKIKELGEQLNTLRAFGDRLFGELSRYFFGFRQGNVVIKSGQPLSYGVIATDRDPEFVKSYLNSLLTWAAQTARAWGAGEDEQGHILLLNQWAVEKPDPNGDFRLRQLSVDEILSRVADALKSDPTVRSAIVRVVSVANTLEGEPVPVDFELFINRPVFAAGEVIDSIVLDGRESEARLFSQLYSFLRINVNQKARARGLLESPEGALGEISVEEAFAAVREVRSLGAPVEIEAVAADTTWTIGPLEIELRLKRS